jgi:uncharacterized protein YutD
MSSQKDKAQLFRNFMKRYQDVMYRGLSIWRENVRFYKHTMDRVKLRLINLHKQNLSKALFKWKEAIDKKHMIRLAVLTEDLQNDNQNLANTLKNQRARQQAMQVRASNRQIAKLQRVRNMINRIMLRQRFNQWIKSSEYILSIADAATLGDKIMQRRRLRNNFNKLRKQVQAMQRVDHIQKRVAWFISVRQAACKNDCYQSWRLWVKRFKQAKKFLIRSSNGLDKQLVNEGFSVWKQMCSIKRQ